MHLYTDESESGFAHFAMSVRDRYEESGIGTLPSPDPELTTKPGVESLMRTASTRWLWIVAWLFLGLSCREDSVTVESIPCPAGPGTECGNLAVGDNGRVYLSWVDASQHAFKFSSWTGNGWSDPRTIYRGRDLGANWTDLPGMTALADGTLFAVWQIQSELPVGTDADMSDAAVLQIAYSRDDGRTWSPPVSPHARGRSSQHAFASWSALSAHEAALIWLDGDEMPAGDHMTLRFARVGADSLPQESLIDERVCDCCPTDLRQLDDGALFALYRDRSETEVRDIALARYEGGHWSEGRLVHPDGWKIAGCPVNGPALDVAGKRVAVAWFTTDVQDRGHVRLAFSEDAGHTFGSPLEIAGANPLGRVDLTLMPDGASWVSWLEGERSSAELHARRVDADGHMGDVVVIAPVHSKPSGLPRMARLGDAIFLVWSVRDAGSEASQISTARLR